MENKKLSVIITGATGMVGEGVLHTCIKDPGVEKILVIGRRSIGFEHPKVTEIIHDDFYNLSSLEERLKDYNACFFCLGVSSVGMNKEDYYKVTYTLTMHMADTLSRLNSGMVFCYVSGMGTDSSEKGKVSWARVKGKAENDLMKLPFRRVYGFRPGFIKPIKGLMRTKKPYKYITWLFPIGKRLYPEAFSTLEEIGLAMIAASTQDYPKNIITGSDISILAGTKS